MPKKVWKHAIPIALGVTLGGTILPRLLRPEMYVSWPPVWQHILIGFIVNYLASVVTLLVMGWLKSNEEEKEV